MNASLQITGLSKRYGSVCALDGVELPVERCAVLALLGPNGAGKSTLFGCLLGLTPPTYGTILWHGKPIGDTERTVIGYMPERVALYSHSSVLENGLFFAGLKNQPSAELEYQLRRVGLYHVRDRKVRQLSKGMLQRLGLAIALCGRPELLILDEPFNGLDPALLEGLQGILRQERERGATMLISTHTMSAIEPLATHVAVLLEGKLAAQGSIEALREQFGTEESLETIYHAIARDRQRTKLEEVFA